MRRPGPRRLARRHLLRWTTLGLAGGIGGLVMVACTGLLPTVTPTVIPTTVTPAAGGVTPATRKPAAPTNEPVATNETGSRGPTPVPDVNLPRVSSDLKNPAEFTAPKTLAKLPTTLTLWHYTGAHVIAQKPIAEEYRKRHDQQVSLEITAYPDLEVQQTAFKAVLAAGTDAPDILAIEPGAHSAELTLSKSILGFKKVFEDDPDYRRSFWPNALQPLTLNGETMAVPTVTNAVVLFFNRRLFATVGAKAPETLNELKALAPLFIGKNITPIVWPAGDGQQQPLFPFYSAIGSMKLDRLMRDADLGKMPWTSPDLIEAAVIAEQIIRSDLIIKSPLEFKQAEAIANFAAGKSAMLWGGEWLRPALRQALAPEFDLGLLPFPAIAGGNKSVLSAVGMTLTVNARSKQPDLAFEMLKAMTGAWGKIEYSRALGLSPSGPISAEAIVYLQQTLKDPLYLEFLKLQPLGTTRLLFTPAVEEALKQGFQAIIAGQKSAREVLEAAQGASKQAAERIFTVG